jgi:hypothetical protein
MKLRRLDWENGETIPFPLVTNSEQQQEIHNPGASAPPALMVTLKLGFCASGKARHVFGIRNSARPFNFCTICRHKCFAPLV